MYSIVDVDELGAELPRDYYDLSDGGREPDTRLIKPLGDALGAEKLRPNVWYYPADATMGGHKHREQEELYYVLEGTLTFTVEGEQFAAESGSAVVIAPDGCRRVIAEEDSVVLIVGAPNAAGDNIPQHKDE